MVRNICFHDKYALSDLWVENRHLRTMRLHDNPAVLHHVMSAVVFFLF